MLGFTDEQLRMIRQRNNGKIPIDYIVDIYDNRRQWAAIPGFFGYQISNDYLIRSYKYKSKYPFGILVVPKRKSKKDPMNAIYEISDNDNMRIEISLADILNLVNSQQAQLFNTTWTLPILDSARNKRMWINQDPELTAQKKGLVKKSSPLNKKETTRMARFTVTDNPEPLIKGDN